MINCVNGPVIECQNLAKTFSDGGLHVEVLKEINFKIDPGEQIAIVGRSGTGKSTLLHLLGGLDVPTAGTVSICGENMSHLSETKRGFLRNKKLGFVYQFHHLLPEFTAIENVSIPLVMRGQSPARAKKTARSFLDKLGLRDRLEHKPAELSGGERQRTAIARALVTEPACILADEPTGNLDQITAQQVIASMLELHQHVGSSLVIVTHDLALAARMDKVYTIHQGILTANT